jgi:YbbR domain-containing protein
MWSQVIFRNYQVHLVIVVIAIFVWFHAITEKQYEHVFQVKVVPVNPPDGQVITNHDNQKVGVLFRSSGKVLIRQLIGGKIEITANLEHTTASRVDVRLDLKDLQIPRANLNLEPIKFIDSDTLSFYFEHVKEKEVSVFPKVNIVPVPGYTIVGGIQLKPSNVLITGPQSDIDNTDSIATGLRELKNVNSDVAGQIALINPFPGRVALTVKTVSYSADIQQLGEKSFIDIPVLVYNAPRGIEASVLPSTLSLKIKGGVELIESIDKGDIIAYVDYRHYETTGESILPPLVKAPDEVDFFDVFPDKFELKRE